MHKFTIVFLCVLFSVSFVFAESFTQLPVIDLSKQSTLESTATNTSGNESGFIQITPPQYTPNISKVTFYSVDSFWALLGLSLYPVDSNVNVGIGTSTPTAKLTVVGEGGLATFGSGATATGNQSIAVGLNANASGLYSLVGGANSKAIGQSSTALGRATTSSGFASTTLGYGTIASGSSSLASGSGTRASGEVSTAFGVATTASGLVSVAFGSGTTSSGNYSMAFGHNLNVSGQNTTVFALSGGKRDVTSDNVFAILGGRVGVGTGAPRTTLEVNGTINSTGDICIIGGPCLSSVTSGSGVRAIVSVPAVVGTSGSTKVYSVSATQFFNSSKGFSCQQFCAIQSRITSCTGAEDVTALLSVTNTCADVNLNDKYCACVTKYILK